MSLQADDVKNIAHLARIAIDENDIPEYAKNLSKILDFVDQLNQADTDGIEPMAHPLDMAQRLRVDEVTEENLREKLQTVAPKVESGLFLVPKVIE